MKKTTIFLMSVLMLSAASCTKGEIGPEGPKGEKGENGVPGISGTDGTKILSGSAAPAANIGATGDFYLRTSNSVLYGPKTPSGWGSGVSLKGATGATGATGAAGTKLLSGTSIPTAAQGAAGDFYFQTTTGVLYGPKTGNSWGAGTSLKGPKGDKGDKGETGNANVKMFEVGPRTTSGGVLFIDLPVSKESREKSTVLVYLSYNGAVWMPANGHMNGVEHNRSYDYITQVTVGAISNQNQNTRVTISLMLPDRKNYYTAISKRLYIRAVFIESSEVTKIAKGIDLKNFDEVKAALKL